MKSAIWDNAKVLVTGGTGFIGSHVVESLVQKGAIVTVLDSMRNGNIKNIGYLKDRVRFLQGNCANEHDALNACKGQEVVMNLAARVGGIEYNRTHQASMLHDNLLIEAVMMNAAQKAGVGKFLVVSSACVYPRECIVPTPESQGFVGDPEPTNGGYGWAKRVGELLGKYYHEQYKMDITVVRPYNCYGPRDHFDEQTSHVIPALIRRVLGPENPVIVWGSGKQTRAFLYVEDLAEAMIRAVKLARTPDPINLGTDEEVTIQDLVAMIVNISHVDKTIQFDSSRPDGSPRRNSDNTYSHALLGAVAKTPLSEGLKKTIDWYRKNIFD